MYARHVGTVIRAPYLQLLWKFRSKLKLKLNNKNKSVSFVEINL
jgi:hypothetical protein